MISDLTILIAPPPEHLHGTEYVQGADQAGQADTNQDDVHQPEDKFSCLFQHVLKTDASRLTIIFKTLLRERTASLLKNFQVLLWVWGEYRAQVMTYDSDSN